MKTIIVSDLHIGAPLSRMQDLSAMIHRESPDVLIINGDIFAGPSVDRFTDSEFSLLHFLSVYAQSHTVIAVRGNHDLGNESILSGVFGLAFHDEYRFNLGELKCVAIHGHQFDGFQVKYKRLSNIISFLYRELQRVPFIRNNIAEIAERAAANWQRLTPMVAKRALDYAEAHNIDIIFCGHTHHMCFANSTWATYYNSGCWLGTSRNYVVFVCDENGGGLISLEDYE